MSATRSKRLNWHPDAIAELAESLAWYAARNPTAAKRMRKVIEDAAQYLVASVSSLVHVNYPLAITHLSP